ncbi:hypothetical protein KRM28CT15_60800 [Krasilnikovia sp. M28-CT-15]
MLSFLARVLGESRSDEFLAIYLTLWSTPFLLALSGWQFRRGRAIAWILAVVTQLTMLTIIVGCMFLGVFVGLAALILFTMAAWVLANLFRAEVRGFFFA